MENNQNSSIRPKDISMLIKLRNALVTGKTQEYSQDELTEMVGIMAKAAAVFYFSEKDKARFTDKEIADRVQMVMDAASNLLIEPSQKAFAELTEEEMEENKLSIWDECTEAYIAYFAKKLYNK